MAWLWWLLAPVASTALGALVSWWRGTDARWPRRTDPVSEHQALLQALAHDRRAGPPLPAARPPIAAE
jgi:hypothetical protein